MQRKTDALMFPLTEPYIIPTTFLALDHRDIKVTKEKRLNVGSLYLFREIITLEARSQPKTNSFLRMETEA